jgi:hypothetical protein
MYFSGFIQERNWSVWSAWQHWNTYDCPSFSVTPMNQALLGGDGSLLDQCVLSPCSEDEDDASLAIRSNLWESIRISRHLGENIEDLFSIDMDYNSSLPKNKSVLCPPKNLPQELFNFTQGERLRARLAIYPVDLEELSAIVSFF